MSDKSSKIYVDLASLFDLRHSALSHMLGEDAASTLVTQETYNLREHDQLPNIDLDLFQQYLQSQDLRMLEAAPTTYVQVALSSKVQNIEKRNTFMADNSTPEVVLNIYPFEMTQSQCDLLQNALFIKLGKCSIITIVREDPKSLTPHYLKNAGFIACFMYDFSLWANHHAKAVESGDLKEVLMYFPALYKEPPTKEDTKVFTKLGFKDVFSYTEYLFTGRMQLNFLPVFFFSSIVTATVFLDAHKDSLKPESPNTPKDSAT